jgi:hypothetical protein
MSEVPALWQPSKFEGSDLLPIPRAVQAEDKEEIVGRENVSTKDLILPSLKLLQGMTPEVVNGSVEGARAGLILHSGTQQVFRPPIRVLLVHHSKSNSLIPDPTKDPRHTGLEKCISRDAVIGSVYGNCEECRKCLDWGENNKPPLGAASHNFVAMTEFGPAVLRFSRTMYKAARQFVSMWMMSDKNLWHHPVVLRVKQMQKPLPNGQQSTFFVWDAVWQAVEQVPQIMKAKARELHNIVQTAYEAGRFDAGVEEPTDDV